MLLTYSIGNDVISLGFLKDGELVGTASISSSASRTADEYAIILEGLLNFRHIDKTSFDGAICASVVPTLTEAVRAAVEMVLGVRPHVIGAGTKTGLRILTDDPTQLGADLVASAVGALTDHKPPMILINFGTATTFSVLDEDGSFIGCAIAPGVELSANALSSGASLLPHISQSMPKKCIGTNTMESMQSGCIFGNAAMVDGMISRIEKELGSAANVIISGKDAEHISSLCEHEMLRDDTMLLCGLAEIYKKNMRKKK